MATYRIPERRGRGERAGGGGGEGGRNGSKLVKKN